LSPSRVKLTADQTYDPTESGQNQLMADVGDYLSFIGAVVVDRTLWQQRDKDSFFGTEFIHMGVIFQAPLPREAKLLVHPWLVIRYGNAQWISRHFEIWMLNWPTLVWSSPSVADWAKSQVVPREPWRDWRRLLLDRAMGRFGMAEYSRRQSLFHRSKFLSLAASIIARFPIRPLNTLARWYVIYVARKNPSIALYDLNDWRDQASRKR